jgi:magnesium chelatase family protein
LIRTFWAEDFAELIFLMAVKLNSYCLRGLNASEVNIEVDVVAGMPIFSMIGMAGTSIKEARDRVRSAISHSGFRFPLVRKVVNLAPAEISKNGSHFDLPIAIGLLIASGQIADIPSDVLLIGELGLEGGVRAVSGVLPALIYAKESGIRQVLMPLGNLQEASLIEGVEIIGVKSLREAVGHFNGIPIEHSRENFEFREDSFNWNFSQISGHAAAKRALLVAAAGGHHVLMSGPPGSGKSLMAKTFVSILPGLAKEELLEVLKIFSISGRSLERLSLNRPFRVVHNSSSEYVLCGGGPELSPGEVSLAHRGVLFLDELPEFSRAAIESLRQSLEEKELVLKRGKNIVTYPCQFQLIAAMNPCPCGFYGDLNKHCTCHPSQVARYQQKISGPILDRIDIHRRSANFL